MQVTDGPTRVYVLGAPALYAAFQKIIEKDLARAETLTAPFIAIVLVALFGALVAAMLPLALAIVSVVITFGAVFFAASATEMSVFVTTMVSMIGIGVAVDYSMFVLARFREELAAGADPDDAVDTAMRTSGTAVVFSGLTVVLALLALWLVPVRAVQSMAAGAMMVVTVAVLASSTLLPALLHILGRRVDRGRIRRRSRPGRDRRGEFWERWVGADHAPAAALVLRVGRPPDRAHAAGDLARDRQPHARADAAVVADRRRERRSLVADHRPRAGRGGRDLDPRAAVLRRRLGARPRGAPPRSEGEPRPPRPGHDDPPARERPEHPGADPRRPGVRAGRERARPAAPEPRPRAIRSSARASVNVGGVSAFNYDLNQEVGSDLWMVIAAVVVLAYLVLLVLLRSVLLPLKAVVMNLLSVGAAYGVIVAIFQWGWLDFTGFHHLGHLNTINPSLILAITFGLSMDYEVFLLTRIRERYELHGSNERAVAEGIATSARIITSAAAIMVVVFGSFALTGVPAIKEVGVGLASAIAIDATITRLVLVPATMRLLGDWNWWLPGWLDRRLPQMAHEAPAAGDW